MLNTSFQIKHKFKKKNILDFFYFIGSEPDTEHLGLGRTWSDHEQWRCSPLFTRVMEHTTNEGEREVKEEEQE